MKVVALWRDNTDYAREIVDWLENFERRTGKRLESLDPDTVEGGDFAAVHDIWEFPAIVAVDDSGVILQDWKGVPLPMVDEVSYYAQEK